MVYNQNIATLKVWSFQKTKLICDRCQRHPSQTAVWDWNLGCVTIVIVIRHKNIETLKIYWGLLLRRIPVKLVAKMLVDWFLDGFGKFSVL